MSLLDELVNLVGKSAPILASVLGGPFGSIGTALVGSLFGHSSSDLAGLIGKIVGDPTAFAKLKELELNHEKELRALEATNYQTEVDDRKNARAREVALKDYIPTILAIGFLINYAAIQFYCVMHNNTQNDIISARFQDVLIMIVSYYFGSAHRLKS